jgi:predicted small lipoprotein YifL
MPHTNGPHPEERSAGARLEGRTALLLSSGAFSTQSKPKIVLIRLLVLLFIVVALAGCGKKGAPQPPPDEPNTFPRSYPNV